ncbi:hypothetical protein OIU34_15710 [Pararhizobium sp. BT-229]|uniref:hypothetical protein n=1 Tax=Pararhizobium sp. BT-229 TaxID=2986923 RepID=UPI0021F79E5A|nr:hypothetical protein [Pararhizobium sp. BT-229]MCV9963353.1 hypothetical protein [Pararhizobium sp. BT-229]
MQKIPSFGISRLLEQPMDQVFGPFGITNILPKRAFQRISSADRSNCLRETVAEGHHENRRPHGGLLFRVGARDFGK